MLRQPHTPCAGASPAHSTSLSTVLPGSSLCPSSRPSKGIDTLPSPPVTVLSQGRWSPPSCSRSHTTSLHLRMRSSSCSSLHHQHVGATRGIVALPWPEGLLTLPNSAGAPLSILGLSAKHLSSGLLSSCLLSPRRPGHVSRRSPLFPGSFKLEPASPGTRRPKP